MAASFALMTRVSSRLLARAQALRWRLPIRVSGRLATATSLLAFAVAVVLIIAGIVGSRDPLANPLPLVVWSVWWIGLSYLHALLGNLWACLNPWRGLHAALTAIGPLRRWRDAPPLSYPRRLGEWPAVVGLLLFAWFELIHPAPSDPAILAKVVAAYLLVHLAGALLVGREWLGRAETFAVFFRMISAVAPLGSSVAPLRADESAPRVTDAGPVRHLEVRLPAIRLLDGGPLPPSGVAFVLLVLAAVSFDGLSRTFAWLAFLGFNPLLHPGRTSLMAPNTAALLGVFAVLAMAYLLAVRLASPAGGSAPPARPAGTFVRSLVPISCGYHFAHYLPALLVDVQYALRAASDPFARGWDLLGTRDLHVVTSFLSDASRVYTIWHTQVALIVGAHVTGVVIAHGLALRGAGPTGVTGRRQLPLLLLMIGYTMLGLWLLSTPTAG